MSYPKSFLVIDNADIDDMLSMVYEEMELTLRDMPFSKARDMIEMKKCVFEPEYYRDMIAMPISTLYEKYHKASNVEDIIFYGYLYQEKKCFALDYNDLIKFTLYILKSMKTYVGSGSHVSSTSWWTSFRISIRSSTS